ncbi:hypothetical protein TrRE_jg893, partial [Triparma retinervis]
GLLLTSPCGCATPWISRSAFLHVSNKEWGGYGGGDEEDGEVHISNCCANSGNEEKFKGEICVDLEEESKGGGDENFKGTWGMVKQAVRGTLMAFSKYTSLSGPPEGYSQASYLGIDVIITKDPNGSTSIDILEINAPPSLDTATGIPSAERTHSCNVGGIFKQFVEGCKGGDERGRETWVRLTHEKGRPKEGGGGGT